jgi:hypothetical protein
MVLRLTFQPDCLGSTVLEGGTDEAALHSPKSTGLILPEEAGQRAMFL